MFGTVNGFSASIGTTHGEMVVAKFLPKKPATGKFSQAYISCAEKQ